MVLRLEHAIYRHTNTNITMSRIVTRPSNCDCACLRLSQGYKVGSYPLSAYQPSILPSWLIASCNKPYIFLFFLHSASPRPTFVSHPVAPFEKRCVISSSKILCQQTKNRWKAYGITYE